MSSISRISLIGAGAIGSFYATKLFDYNRDCISLIAREKRAERLTKEGIFINNRHILIPVRTPEDKNETDDLVIVAVKYHHLSDTINDIKNCVGDNTLILSIMNGIDSEEKIGSVYGMDKMLYGVAVGIDAVRIENRVTYTNEGKLFFGEADNSIPGERVTRLKSLFEDAGIISEIPQDMIRTLWWKYMINVGINQVSAVLRAPYGVFQKSQEARDLVDSAMREVTTIAEKANVHIYEEDIADWYKILAGLSPGGKTSMLQDVEARRKTEVEMLAGTVIEIGEEYKIPTPVNQVLFRLIKIIEQSFL
jgi:2-dehydropantoate 2-reductase